MTEDPALLRLVIVDNHDVVRRGLRSVLELEPDVLVLGEASDPRSAHRVIAATHPDVVLLDLKLGADGPSEGLDLLSELSAKHPSLVIVVFTAFMSAELASEAIRRGARGYVQKDVDVVELMRILRGVVGGGAGFDTQTARLLLGDSTARDPRTRAGQLTEREQTILSLVAAGCTNREIAARCLVSESTVKYHLRALFRRFEVSHRAQLARLAGSPDHTRCSH